MPQVGTLVSGNVRTDQVLAAKVPVNMDRHIHLQETSKYLFEYIVRSIRKSKAETNMRCDFLEQRPHPLTVVGTAIEAAGQTVIAVDNGTYVKADQLLYNTRTNEMYLVASISSNNVTIVNHAAGTGGVTFATAVGDIMLILPEAHAEGEAIPAAYSQQPVEVQTYLMQSDSVRGNTDIQRRTAEYGMKQLLVDRKLKWIEYKRGKDLLMYLGKNVRETTSGDGRRHTSRGMREYITTNKEDFSTVGGGLSLQTVAELIRRTTAYSASSDVKVGVCGQNAWAQISAMPNTAIRTTVSEEQWGKRLKTLITGHGNLAVGYDPILKQENGLQDIFVIFDPAHICHAHLQGEPERLILNVEDNTDIHNQVDVITGTFGLLLMLEELHAWGYGIN